MIATKKRQIDIKSAGKRADEYISTVFGSTYFTYDGEERDDHYHFMVKCLRDDMKRNPAVGSITVFESGDVQVLSEDRIRDMKEAGETQAAQHRKELARDEDGYVLRYHARINASCWLADTVGHKLGATGGLFIPSERPIWRFTVQDFVMQSTNYALAVIDVNARTGEVLKPNEEEIEIIIRGVCASRKHQKYTAAI